jgi:chromosome segregation protein
MNLKKLELFGFKSFMRKLDIHFSDGVTIIVGPNGCGKTNVTDALRWVLGEGNARMLRGNRMEDLIFNGTRDYKPLNIAEVGLTIDNSAGFLPIDFSEVTVTRRVLRSGDSEFFINKAPCRLKDITDLFLDTGLGSRAYSVIERDMVEMVLSDQPERRRELLEEAAGIMKYKIRERQAQRKLAATDDDLVRITDVLNEVERSLRSLRRQVGAARRFQELKERRRELEIALALVDLAELRGRESELERTHSENRAERDGAQTRIAALETDLESLRLKSAEADSEFADLQRQVDELAEQVRKSESENLIRGQRRETLQEKSARLAREKEELEARLHSETQRREELDRRVHSHEDAIVACDGELAEAEGLLARVSEDLDERRGELAAARERGEASAAQLAGLNTELANLEAHAEHLADRDAVLEEEARRLEELASLRRRETSEARSREESLRAELAACEAALAEAGERRDQVAATRESAREEQARLAVEAEAARSGLEMLESLRDSYEGYGRGAKTLLTHSGGDSRLVALADSLHVNRPELLPALESALEAAVQYVVAPSGAAALAALDSLVEGEGRATVVDREAFRADDRPGSAWEPQDSAIVAPARALLDVDGKLSSLVDFLLAHTWVVETLADAARLARDPNASGCRFIARDGSWAAHPGILHGGSRRETAEGSILGRSDRIAELKARVADCEGQRRRAGERVEALGREMAEQAARIAQLEGERDRLRAELTQEGRASERSVAEASACQSRLANLGAERETLTTRACELAAKADALRGELAQREESQADLLAEVRRREAELFASAQDRDGAQRRCHDLRLERQRLTGELEKAQLDIARLEEGRCSDEEGIALRITERAETDRHIAELVQELEDGAQRLHLQTERVEERRRVRDAVAAERAEVLERLRAVEEERRRWNRLQEQSAELVHETDMELTRVRAALEELRGRSRRELGLDLDSSPVSETRATLIAAPPEERERAREELDQIRRQIDRLGPVNMIALEQYEREGERHAFLKTQKEDLEAARESLRRTIRKVNRKARTLFMQTLEQVRHNFRVTYGELFEGGHADIRLSGDEDPLLAAIELFARPRGKRLSNISLLSSGERALTAVAFLFAIYLVKPSPFCILDEVDAPLDDANIGRFLKMLRRVAAKTQFVMITHNKKTMEVGDVLYGVTMEEPGVSRLVSVRLGADGPLGEEPGGNGHEDEPAAEELVLEGSA